MTLSTPVKILLVLASAAILVALFIVLRSGGDEGDTSAPPPRTNPPRTAEPPPVGAPPRRNGPRPPETNPAPPERPSPTVVRISVRGGRVLGGVKTTRLQQGRAATIVVTADVRDHVHLHGYNIMRDVAPGSPAVIGFGARLAGRFEIELEDRHLRIGQLEIRP